MVNMMINMHFLLPIISVSPKQRSG